MFKEKWLNLQLFAGEGAGDGGGEGAATGEGSADAGHQRLLELGVPASKIRKNRAYSLNTPTPKPAEAKQEEGQEQKQEQAAAADNPAEEQKPESPARMSWEDIMKDPEYNQQMQAVIRARLKSANGAQENLGKLAPALEVLARQYDMDPENLDYEELAKRVSNDKTFYTKKAVELGLDEDAAMKFDQMDREQKRQARTLEQQRIDQHIARMEQQGEELKKVFPNFDLRAELKNPVFARLTAPSVGLSVEDAYHAVHRKEIQTAAMQATAQKTAEKLSNAIQAGGQRPSENGTSGKAPSVTTFDYSKASPEERAKIKAYLRAEAAQGRNVLPGSYHGR